MIGTSRKLIWMKTKDENGMYSYAAPFGESTQWLIRGLLSVKQHSRSPFILHWKLKKETGRLYSLPRSLVIMFWAALR